MTQKGDAHILAMPAIDTEITVNVRGELSEEYDQQIINALVQDTG